MEALGLKAQSSIQTYDGMRRVDMVCSIEVSVCVSFADSGCWTRGYRVFFLFASSESLKVALSLQSAPSAMQALPQRHRCTFTVQANKKVVKKQTVRRQAHIPQFPPL